MTIAAILPFLQAAFYAAGAVAAADAALQKPPENKTMGTASPAGGGATSPQQIFSQGQPTPKAPALPQGVQAPNDPVITATTQALAQGQQAPMAVPAQGLEGPLPVPMSATPQQAAAGGGIGEFLAGLNNAGGAISAMAPLLGFGPEQMRGIHTAGAAGGQPGQPVFQLPQRNTLAQILASLPRTYNG